MSKSIKDNLKSYYNTEAELRNSKSQKPEWKIRVRNNFYNLIIQENKKTLLELGAGAGYDSLFFLDNGFKVTAIDISVNMVEKCKQKGIEAYELDFYNLSALNKKYDCIYAINTLLHVPKADLLNVLNEISSVLNANGMFFMGVYGGDDTEETYVKSEVSDSPRFFALHSKNYLVEILSKVFEIVEFNSFEIGNSTDIFHSIILRKKNFWK